MARYHRISAKVEHAFEHVKNFKATRGADDPVVLKPDCGKRGQRVEIVKDEVAARRCWAHCEEVFVAQELVEGLESGKHGAKFSDDAKGMIRSLCGKHPRRSLVTGGRFWKSLSCVLVLC